MLICIDHISLLLLVPLDFFCHPEFTLIAILEHAIAVGRVGCRDHSLLLQRVEWVSCRYFYYESPYLDLKADLASYSLDLIQTELNRALTRHILEMIQKWSF